MSKYIPGNQKHLSLEDRKYIERSLNNDYSFKDITQFLCKNPILLFSCFSHSTFNTKEKTRESIQ